MSWFFGSLQSNDPGSSTSSPASSPSSPVKDDLSAIGQSIGRQLRGVANFLAPPPTTTTTTTLSSSSQPSSAAEAPSQPGPSSQALIGIRNDLAEIGGSLKSGLSLLSSNKAVSGFSKFTSGFLQFKNNGEEEEEEDEDGEDEVAGITEEVVGFVREISGRPECWNDFPLSLDDQDFRMSDAQREHASTIERIIPGFTSLRLSLHNYMGDEQFWMVYFILLLPRLSEHDSDVLSTPQIIETRNVLLQKLKDKRNVKVESSENSDTFHSQVTETLGENIPSRVKETEIVNAMEGLAIDEEENNQWLGDTDVDTNASSLDNQKRLLHEEDVSFSDLEDDDNELSTRQSASRRAQGVRDPSPSGSSDWVQCSENSDPHGALQRGPHPVNRDKDSDGDSTDWLNVDDYD
ncbi:hypothetical protein Tsubulata_001778 [Turnera subulata]|uniref:BSD domain-containing protein n=1 Tax=Turnera subulata TaxID=218843 RepID=A0A9Q0J7B7_9ROSI|nr:hypothetical protein Tsubulata_001778 [Turnera subulata]